MINYLHVIIMSWSMIVVLRNVSTILRPFSKMY